MDNSNNNKFDQKKFNNDFETKIKEQNDIILQNEEDRLRELNLSNTNKTIFEYNIGEIIIGIKDTWFDILDDIFNLNFSYTLFTKNNRLYFISITFILFGIILFLYNYLFSNDFDNEDTNMKTIEKIIEIRHINTPSAINTPLNETNKIDEKNS